MADYYGYARSNYFRVKDMARFKAAMDKCDVRIITGVGRGRKGKVALLATGEAGWDSSYVDGNGKEINFNIIDIVAPRLEDGEVAVFMSIGYEKLRYLAGDAFAINNRMECVSICLSDIYSDPRVKKLGRNITKAEC
ncbi:MAG TPA: hypothetical protein DCZ94_09030 [Lentisphaeria bacterium]|nr:MAG: hypothetical protein A2X48_23375 [Lentisphaerae bacterium GWF2_49_21]HBC87083.1 hypothetical protein [Lentisphaeria bacterium]